MDTQSGTAETRTCAGEPGPHRGGINGGASRARAVAAGRHHYSRAALSAGSHETAPTGRGIAQTVPGMDQKDQAGALASFGAQASGSASVASTRTPPRRAGGSPADQ